jgi:hypothetical protein
VSFFFLATYRGCDCGKVREGAYIFPQWIGHGSRLTEHALTVMRRGRLLLELAGQEGCMRLLMLLLRNRGSDRVCFDLNVTSRITFANFLLVLIASPAWLARI